MPDYINPDRDSFRAFAENRSKQPVQMLNLIKLNEAAVYEDGAMVSGREAYAAYSRASGPVFRSVGGRIIWSGKYELTLIGPDDEDWDIAFIAEYPTSEAFVSMVRNEDYQKAVKHRTAAVKTSRLIRLSPAEAGDAFG